MCLEQLEFKNFQPGQARAEGHAHQERNGAMCSSIEKIYIGRIASLVGREHPCVFLTDCNESNVAASLRSALGVHAAH